LLERGQSARSSTRTSRAIIRHASSGVDEQLGLARADATGSDDEDVFVREFQGQRQHA